MSDLTNEQLIVMARKIGLKPITAEVYDEYQGIDLNGDLCKLRLEAYVYDPRKAEMYSDRGRFVGWRKIECASANKNRSVIYLGVDSGTWDVAPEYLVFIPKEIETAKIHLLPPSQLDGPETSSNHRIVPTNESYKTPETSAQSDRSCRKRN